MAKAAISIGDDTPTGEPDTAPEGPYITANDDGSRRKRRKSTAARTRRPQPGPTTKRPRGSARTDF
jgi:hypothetical protein